MRSIFSGDIKIEGDMDVGRKFQALFEQLDPDFEEALSNYTGDVIAHKTGQVFRSGHDWGQETLRTLQLNTSEFLQDETRDLPAQPEIDIFFKHVDELRSDADRLDARIVRLKQYLLDNP
jgi:ubiquinone biosynthesis protein UbiJ